MIYVKNAISTVSQGVADRAVKAIGIIPCAAYSVGYVGLTAVGLLATPFAAITFGKIYAFKRLANFSGYSVGVLPSIFETAIKIINPNAKIENKKSAVVAGFLMNKINPIVIDLRNNKSWFKSQILSRAFPVLIIPTSVIGRIADTVLAVGAVAASVVTFGSVSKINEFAANQLASFGGIFKDFSGNLCFIVNPKSVCFK